MNDEEKYKEKAWLREQWIEHDRTMADIADDFGVNETTIHYYIREKFALEKYKDYDDPDWLRHHYQENNRGQTEIAKLSDWDISPATISRNVAKYSITKKHRDHDWLREQYNDELRTTGDIATECGVCPQTVANNLEDAGVELVEPDEKWNRYTPPLEGVTGPDHPWWGRTGDDHPRYTGYDPTWRREAEWVWTKKRIRWRDEYECQLCGNNEDLHVHHITPESRGGPKLDPFNLETLCEGCHIDVHRSIYNPVPDWDSNTDWIAEPAYA